MSSNQQNPKSKDSSIAHTSLPMRIKKHIALVAHDHRKEDMLDWAEYNKNELAKHELYGTGTTGGLIQEKLNMHVNRFMSGPLGGDQQMGAAIAEGRIDILIFFWDPLQAQPHDVDVKALQRLSVVYNIPMASNRSAADFLITSPLMNQTYERFIVDYSNRLKTEDK